MTVRASAVARSSGSYNSAAHAPRRTQVVKLAGAWSGSLLSPARKLLRLNFAGSSFIEVCIVLRSPTFPGTLFPSKTDNFVLHQIPYEVVRYMCIPRSSVSAQPIERGSDYR